MRKLPILANILTDRESCMYMFLNERCEGRKKEASKVKQTTRQSNTAHPRQSLFLEKMSCLGWDCTCKWSKGIRKLNMAISTRDSQHNELSNILYSQIVSCTCMCKCTNGIKKLNTAISTRDSQHNELSNILYSQIVSCMCKCTNGIRKLNTAISTEC